MTAVQLGLLRVDYVVTVDDFDGAPLLPGFVDDGIFWALVARLHEGRTQWRRTLEKKWLSEYGALCLRLSAAEPLVVIPRHIWGPYPRRDAAMTMPLELFAGPADPPCHAAAAPIDPLYGLFVQLSDTCRCGSRVAIIGEGKGLVSVVEHTAAGWQTRRTPSSPKLSRNSASQPPRSEFDATTAKESKSELNTQTERTKPKQQRRI
jgi:hypothetical protein